jgi:hypothetical protein
MLFLSLASNILGLFLGEGGIGIPDVKRKRNRGEEKGRMNDEE